MTHHIVVLGAGTGGTLTANRLRSRYTRDEATITVVDQDDRHVYQPGLLFVPFGLAHPDEIVRPRARQLHDGIGYVTSAIDHVDIEQDKVHLENGDVLDYDVLVVATGARLVPEETPGLSGPASADSVFTFYDLEGATALAGRLDSWNGGRLVVNVVDMPIKCPVAPLEFCFLADWFFTERGIRDDVEITYVTPLDGAFTKPTAARACSPACWPRRASSSSPSSIPGKSMGSTGASSRTTAARFPSTWRSSCPCTVARSTSVDRPDSVTSSISCRPTTTRSRRTCARTSS